MTRSDDLHAGFGAATFARWITIPLVASLRAQQASPGTGGGVAGSRSRPSSR